MCYSTLSWQIDYRVLTLTLNRPAQLNAFTTTMADELVDAYEHVGNHLFRVAKALAEEDDDDD